MFDRYRIQTQMYFLVGTHGCTPCHFVVCFAFDQVNSFSNVTSTWVPEIKGVVRDATLLLVGCKCDVRDDDKVKQRFSDAHVAQVTDADV